MIWVLRGFLGVAGLAAFFLFAGLFLPGSARVEESIFIARPAATVYTLAADPRAVAQWAPWRIAQPEAVVTVANPTPGVGGAVAWRASQTSGVQTIRSVEPYILVNSEIAFQRGGAARTSLSVLAQTDGSQATWRYEADHGLDIIGRFTALFAAPGLRSDGQLGLARLKAMAEELAEADFADADITEVDIAPQSIVFAERAVRGDLAEQEAAFAEALQDVQTFMAARGLAEAGPIISVTLDNRSTLWRFQVAIPYVGRQGEDGAAVAFGETQGGRTLKAVHRGDVRRTGALYDKLQAYMDAHRLRPAGPVREVWVTERATTLNADMITEIYLPVSAAE